MEIVEKVKTKKLGKLKFTQQIKRTQTKKVKSV